MKVMPGVTALPEPGARIRLIQMGRDPNPIEPGAEGLVYSVVDLTALDMGVQIGVTWDNGRSLNLCVPPDTFEIIL